MFGVATRLSPPEKRNSWTIASFVTSGIARNAGHGSNRFLGSCRRKIGKRCDAEGGRIAASERAKGYLALLQLTGRARCDLSGGCKPLEKGPAEVLARDILRN